MNKIAAYLQEHILGEVSSRPEVLKAMSRDASVLEIAPEMVVYPRVTNDIRKVARFAWQLAEKGHVMPITTRGAGTDQTGGAIGTGIVISTPAHMNRVLEFDSKQKLIRVQPGLNAKSLNDALLLHGMAISSLPASSAYSTIGGAVMNNASGATSGRYGDMRTWTGQLEIVLANGDVLQTERINKRELSRRKGLQTFEGEIYRNLDNLIEDRRQLIEDRLLDDVRDNVGYSAIARVKGKDGSFDLTPLFVGSQGTLGILSEMIMKAEFTSPQQTAVAIALPSGEAARDLFDSLEGLFPSVLEYFDGEYFALAEAQGRTYEICRQAGGTPAAVILVVFDDFSERVRQRGVKKIRKLLTDIDAYVIEGDGADAAEVLAIREVSSYLLSPSDKELSSPPIVDGAYVPRERYEDFSTAVAALAKKHSVSLPVHSRIQENVHYVRPSLQLRKVGDKQKIFKLIDEYATLVDQHRGHLIGEAGEGRIKAPFAYKHLDSEVLELFQEIKTIFDPHGILNPGVKQSGELRDLVAHLRADYDMSVLGDHTLYN
jgi:FAD/FMN-containing dehydrogenase